MLGKKNSLYSAGLNLTKTSKTWRILTMLCLKGFNNVELRDKLSFRYIRKYSNISNLRYNFDSVYLYWKIITDPFKPAKKKKYLTYFLSEPAKNNNRRKEEFIQISNYINRHNAANILIVCQTMEDLKTANILISMIKNKKCKAVLYSFKSLSNIIFQISKSKLIITERYHGGVIAEALGIEWVAASQTEKLTRLLPNKFKINETIFY
jgi:polysaccharide pyruvyl transferase WcaK-like protein